MIARLKAHAQEIFAIFFIGFLFVQFVVTAAAVTTLYFYAFLLLSYLWFLYRNPAHVHDLLHHRLMRFYLVFMGFILVHAVFISPEPAFGKSAGNLVANLIFLLATASMFATTPYAKLERYISHLGLLAGACAAYSIARHLIDPVDINRLLPVGRADNQVLAAFVYVIGLACTLFAASYTASRCIRALQILSALVIAFMIALTESRLAILIIAIVACMSLPFSLRQPHLRKPLFALVIAGALLAALLAVALQEPLLRYLHALLERGDSYRIELWETTIATIAQRPWQGGGLFARIDHHHTASAHNIYLASALQLGLPGAFLLLLAIGATLYDVIRLYPHHRAWVLFAAILLMNGLLSGTIDHSRVVRGPAPLWIIFWLPIGMVLGLGIRLRREAAPASQTAQR